MGLYTGAGGTIMRETGQKSLKRAGWKMAQLVPISAEVEQKNKHNQYCCSREKKKCSIAVTHFSDSGKYAENSTVFVVLVEIQRSSTHF